jgi:choline dehydrogenase-like flavoprotein
MHEVAIVGAGAAGIAAALELSRLGVRPLILDVGHEQPQSPAGPNGDLYDLRRRNDTHDLLIGERFEGLANVIGKRQVPVKLTSPAMAYVTRHADSLAPLDATSFAAVQSFAMGGLANAWGAGLYRFTTAELEDFPFPAADLEPYYDRLTDEIGICGIEDDLAPSFGSTRNLLPPIRLAHNCQRMLDRYQTVRAHFGDEFRLGHSRTGALTRPWDGRPAIAYDNLEFWRDQASLYKPRLTLEKLIRQGRVDYHPGLLVQSWQEEPDGIRVQCLEVAAGRQQVFSAQRLLLAAGAINTTKIVLASRGDCTTTLPLLENPALQIPLVLLASVGRPLDEHAFGLVQLNLVWQSPTYDAVLQGSLMEITSPRRSDFFASLPYAAHDNLALLRYLLPAMVVVQVFFPASCQAPARLRLNPNGRLRLDGCPNLLDLGKLDRLLRWLRRLGGLTHPSLIVRVPTGHAIHYAGTIPMQRRPDGYACDSQGRLAGTRNIFIADSASFPALPAKNMSLTMMANAMRVAAGACGV